MVTYRFTSFQISIVEDDIAEIVVFNNTEFTLQMVNDFHALVRDKMAPQVGVLVNKNYPYSYTFDALVALSRSRAIKSVAVWSNGKIVNSITAYLAKRFNFYKVPVRTFYDRAEALAWLKEVSKSTSSLQNKV